jgi:hypothetical protein
MHRQVQIIQDRRTSSSLFDTTQATPFQLAWPFGVEARFGPSFLPKTPAWSKTNVYWSWEQVLDYVASLYIDWVRNSVTITDGDVDVFAKFEIQR